MANVVRKPIEFVVPLYLVEVFLEPLFPVNRALINDWYALSRYTILFITGSMLISSGDSFWKALHKVRTYALVLGIVAGPVSFLLWYITPQNIKYLAYPLFNTLNMWSWILVIFVYASLYLNKKSRSLEYRNQAVYPFYIWHQTITVIIGYYLMNSPMHYIWKMAILVLGTFGFSWLIFEFVIRGVRIMGILFGVKERK